MFTKAGKNVDDLLSDRRWILRHHTVCLQKQYKYVILKLSRDQVNLELSETEAGDAGDGGK